MVLATNLDTSGTQNGSQTDAKPTQNRLLHAVLESWRDSPGGDVSVRSLTSLAQSSPSAIGYHFGSVEQLYESAQDAAVASAKAWLDERIGQLRPLGRTELGTVARAALIAQLVDDWCVQQRMLAMARLEAASAARRGRSERAHLAWSQLWLDHCRVFGEEIGLGSQYRALTAFVLGESTLHLLQPSRALDRALLDETALAFAQHLAGESVGTPVVRTLCLAAHAYPQHQADDLDRAAAHVLAKSGVASLTFRAVAAAADRPLGQVAYHFGSKSDLLRRAFGEIYRAATDSGDRSTVSSPEPAQLLQSVCAEVSRPDQAVLGVRDEIIMHVARDSAHADMRAMLRAYPDPVAAPTLQALLGRRKPVGLSLGAAFSSMCSGFNQLSLAMAREDAREKCLQALRRFLRPVASA